MEYLVEAIATTEELIAIRRRKLESLNSTRPFGADVDAKFHAIGKEKRAIRTLTKLKTMIAALATKAPTQND